MERSVSCCDLRRCDAPGAPGGALPVSAQFRPPASANLTVGERHHVEAAHVLGRRSRPDHLERVARDSRRRRGPGQRPGHRGEAPARAAARPPSRNEAQIPHQLHADQIRGGNRPQREFTFTGQRYRIGLPVHTEADLTTWRFGYEYDAFYTSRGYVGVVFDVSHTNVDVSLDSPIGREFTEAVAPIPGIGVAGRAISPPTRRSPAR